MRNSWSLVSHVSFKQNAVREFIVPDSRSKVSSFKSKGKILKNQSFLRQDKKLEIIVGSSSLELRRCIDLLKKESSLTWFTTAEENCNMDKPIFGDALLLRYHLNLRDIHLKCPCGKTFDAHHAMSCKKKSIKIGPSVMRRYVYKLDRAVPSLYNYIGKILLINQVDINASREL